MNTASRCLQNGPTRYLSRRVLLRRELDPPSSRVIQACSMTPHSRPPDASRAYVEASRASAADVDPHGASAHARPARSWARARGAGAYLANGGTRSITSRASAPRTPASGKRRSHDREALSEQNSSRLFRCTREEAPFAREALPASRSLMADAPCRQGVVRGCGDESGSRVVDPSLVSARAGYVLPGDSADYDASTS